MKQTEEMSDQMKLSQKPKAELIAIIQKLDRENQELYKDIEQMDQMQFPWTGNLGRWYWDIPSNSVRFNPLKVTTLGIDPESIPDPVTFQFFTDRLHPDDYSRTMNAMKDHLYGQKSVYECEYRIRTVTGTYRWYYDRGKITRVDESGKPVFVAGIVFDITEQKKIEEELKQNNEKLSILALTDPLTGVMNVRALYQKMDELKVKEIPFSVALLDLDDFKQVNDHLGHLEGDKTLVSVAKILMKHSKNGIICGRYGGEEFLVVMPEIYLEKARKIAQDIRLDIEQAFREYPVTVTASIGLADHTSPDIKTLLWKADQQLYKAKDLGKNRIEG